MKLLIIILFTISIPQTAYSPDDLELAMYEYGDITGDYLDIDAAE